MAPSSHTRPPPTLPAAPPHVTFYRVQAKGQVTIDPRVREDLGIRPGDEVVWIRNKEGRWELWNDAELDRLWDEAAEGLEEFLRKSRAAYGKRFRQLEGRS